MSRTVAAIKFIKKFRQFTFGNPNAGISDRNLHIVAVGHERYRYRATLGRVIDRTGNKIEEHKQNALSVDVYGERGIVYKTHGLTPFIRKRLEFAKQFFDE